MQDSTEAPVELTFEVEADKSGITRIEFTTDGPFVMQTLLLILEQVNNSFDKKFEKLSDFVKELANVTESIEGIKHGKAN